MNEFIYILYMDKSYLLLIVIIITILINNYQIENFDLENSNFFNKIISYSKEKYLYVKENVSNIFTDEKKKKKKKNKTNNDCKDIKFDNYKIESNNVISGYYMNGYYNFDDI